mgnify:CR=1 FL=1
MKVGDLVRVIIDYPGYSPVAIILEVDMDHHWEPNVKCLWHDGNINWCPKRRLEVINEMVL